MPEKERLVDLEEEPHGMLFDGAEPRTVRLKLSAGETVPEHRHPDRTVVLYVIEGRIDLSLDGDGHELAAGEAIRFDGDQPISPEAREASTALVVLALDAE